MMNNKKFKREIKKILTETDNTKQQKLDECLQAIRDNEMMQHARDWDFDPKFRTGSISEEDPNQ